MHALVLNDIQALRTESNRIEQNRKEKTLLQMTLIDDNKNGYRKKITGYTLLYFTYALHVKGTITFRVFSHFKEEHSI